MLNIIKKIYKKIPYKISNLIIKIFKLRYISSDKAWNNVGHIKNQFIDISNDKDNYVKIVNKNLNNLLYFCKSLKNNYYSNLFREIKELNINNLQKIDFIDSNFIKNNFNKIINKNINGYFTTTGGTGRSPTPLYLSNDVYFRDYDHVLFSWWINGYRNGYKKLTLRGVNLGKKLVELNPIYNEIQVNIFLMSEKNIEYIYNEIKKFSPCFGHGYPSAFVRFVELLDRKHLSLELKGISFVSEGFNEIQREKVQKYFKCTVTSFYGHSERLAFATEIKEKYGEYYILPSYGLIEIINKDGLRVNEGEFGEIVCTGFLNKGMPLIRYKTGDYAKVLKSTKENIPIILTKLNGRWGKDFIIDKYSNKIPMTAVNIHSEVQYKFKYIQFYQNEIGKLKIFVVPFEKINESDLIKLKLEFSAKLSNFHLEILIRKEEDIYISNNGKIPYLLSDIKEEIFYE